VTLLWQDAVEQYLDSLYHPKKPEEATNRPATRKDYKSKLAVPELLTFRGRAISTITREEVAEANAKTCKRAYDMGWRVAANAEGLLELATRSSAVAQYGRHGFDCRPTGTAPCPE